MQSQPRAAGRVACQAALASATGRSRTPSTESVSPPVLPRGVTRHAVHLGERDERVGLLVGDRHQGAGGRLGEQRHEGVTVRHRGQRDRGTDVAGERRLEQRLRESAVREVVGGGHDAVARGVLQQGGQCLLGGEVEHRRQPAEVAVHDVGPLRAGELLAGLAEQEDPLTRGGEPGRRTTRDVLDDTEHGDDRGRQDRCLAGLVVEADVAARDRDAELEAGVLEATAGLGELPHHGRVLGRAEVEAVGDRQWPGAPGGDVAERLGQRELGTLVGVELGEPAVAVGGDRHAEIGVGVDADHARVGRLGEDGVALDVAVVLVGDPRLVAEVRRGDQLQQRRAEVGTRRRTGERLGAVGLERVLPVRPGVRPVIGRTVVRHRPRGYVHHALAVPVDVQPPGVGHLADDDGLDVPLLADRHERVDVGGLDDRHHPLLRLAHQDLLGRERGVAQRHPVELDVHPAVTGGGELGGRAGQPGTAEVLDAGDHAGGEELEGALDEELLHEGVPDLDARALGRPTLVEGLAREDGHPADAVAAGARAVQHHLVAGAGRVGEVEVLVAQHADAESVDERVAGVGLVEDGLTADVGQAEAVAVAADTGHDPGQHARGVGGVERPEAQRIHDRDGPSPHGEDVADDAADAGGRTLVGLDERRVVVALDLERHGVALADVEDTGVLADAGQCLADRRLLRDLTELLEVHLGRLVGAVLAPHHRVHRQLGAGRAATEDLADPGVLVGLQAQLGPRLLALRVGRGPRDRVEGPGGA